MWVDAPQVGNFNDQNWGISVIAVTSTAVSPPIRRAPGPPKPPATSLCVIPTGSPTPGPSCVTAPASSPGDFDEIFRTEGLKILRTPVRVPVANAFAER